MARKHQKSATRIERLEARQLMADATLAIGNVLYTAGYHALYKSNLDGSNQVTLATWDGGGASNLFALNGKLLFDAPLAKANYYGNEPWVSDGTVAGTMYLKDIYEVAIGSNPSAFHLVNGRAVFTADHDSRSETQLYSTDGTRDGTLEISPERVNGYYGAVNNVAYSAYSVTWDYYSESVKQEQRLTSTGAAGNWSVLYNEADAKGVVHIQPINANPVAVTIAQYGDTITVVDNGTQLNFRTSDVKSIDVTDTSGDDLLTADPSVRVPVTLHTTHGNDSLVGGSGANTVVYEDRQSANTANTNANDPESSTARLTANGGTINFSNGDHVTLSGIFTHVIAGDGNDTVIGTGRNETLEGGWGVDSLVGEGGNDSLDGGLDQDTLVGLTGNDTLAGGWGVNSIVGGGGSDTIVDPQLPAGVTFENGLLTINGTDTYDYISSGQIREGNISFSINEVNFQLPIDQITGIVMNGFGGNDSLQIGATSIPATLNGGDGGDTLFGSDSLVGVTLNGGAGDDQLNASKFDDVINTGSGVDVVSSGDGHDTIYAKPHGDHLMDTSSDDTVIDISDDPTRYDGNGSLGTTGDDSGGNGSGGSTDDGDSGSTGDNGSTGGSTGGDNSGSTGTSGGTTTGSTSATPSWYSLKNGVLSVTGTAADDNIALSDHGATLFVTFDGTLVRLGRSRIDSIVVKGGAGNDQIDARGVSDSLKLYGDAGNDWISGGSAADRIYGGDGSDSIYGGAGNDILYGEAGNDRIFGGAGLDHIDGGAGTNVLRGEDGKDSLTYRKGDNVAANKGDYLLLAPTLA